MSDYNLDRAYVLNTADEARALYQDWAQTYDSSFGAAKGYIAPREIAGVLIGAAPDAGPILDIGAGTGLVAEHLGSRVVDGIDITPEMLTVARGKNLYRDLIEGDLTKPLDMADETYGAVISCGTFTHGHVGPECLPELLRVTKPGAVFCCGTLPAVYDAAGFGSTLALLVAHHRISPVTFHDIAIYEDVDHDHAGDRGLVMVFTRL